MLTYDFNEQPKSSLYKNTSGITKYISNNEALAEKWVCVFDQQAHANNHAM